MKHLPDFTGTWKFSPGRSSLQIPLPESTLFAIEHRGLHFRLSRTHVFGGKPDSFAIDLTTDGRQVEFEHGGVKAHARAYWDGRTLVFDSHVSRAGEEGTNVVRYDLSDDGGTLTARERFRGTTMHYDNIWVMERV